MNPDGTDQTPTRVQRPARHRARSRRVRVDRSGSRIGCADHFPRVRRSVQGFTREAVARSAPMSFSRTVRLPLEWVARYLQPVEPTCCSPRLPCEGSKGSSTRSARRASTSTPAGSHTSTTRGRHAEHPHGLRRDNQRGHRVDDPLAHSPPGGAGLPPAVALIVVATANHFLLEVVGGSLLGRASLALAKSASP
jgi:hypothetical protein